MIRPATTEDAAWIAEIWNAVIDTTTATFTTERKSVGQIEELVDARPDAFLVLPQIGFATFGTFRSGVGYAHVREHTIYLDEAACGQGRGRTLLEALEALAARQGVEIFVGGISGDNDAALNFHLRLGYVEVARMPGLGRKWAQNLDLVLVQKNLQD